MEELKETQKVFDKQCQRAMRLFADQTKKSLDWWMEKAYSHKTSDYWFDAKTAYELGVIDFIGVPIIKKNPPVQVELPIEVDEFNSRLETRSRKDEDRLEEYMKEPSSVENKKKPKKAVKKTTKKKGKSKTKK